jgi:methylated-DNA-[protein]-cysteine S-methyltransferase
MSHASLSTPFGILSVFAEDGALVALEWGEAPEYGTVEPLLRAALDQLDAYFEARLHRFDLPLRPRGTPYQQRVWMRLAAIPWGETATYGQLARELATGSRAVAAACAANPLPILIPCHRVVGAAGSLGGYSGGDGIETKRALLRLENASWSGARSRVASITDPPLLEIIG